MSIPTNGLPIPRSRRQTSAEQAAHYIRELIYNGWLKAGGRVPQREVARALSLSRVPIREALIALEREGWVTFGPDRATFVNTLDKVVIGDSYEVFGLVYGFAATCALKRSGTGFVDRVSSLEQELRGAENAAEAQRLIFEFHRTVIATAHSERIKVVLRGTPRPLPDNLLAVVPGTLEVEKRGIAAITRALRSGDAEAASTEYLKTMRRHAELVIADAESKGILETS